VRIRVDAAGEQTSLALRKRRAGQRLLLGVGARGVSGDLRGLVRLFKPAGFVLTTAAAEEPAQLRELCRELSAMLPAEHPALLFARHERGACCPGATDWPAPSWLARAADLELAREVGGSWRGELAALGFHLHLAPRLGLEAGWGEPVPAVAGSLAELQLGPDPLICARTVAAMVGGGAAAASPALCTGRVDEQGGLQALEKELPGLLAEDLQPVDAAVRAGVPALLVGYRVWSAFHEELPACLSPRLLRGQLRQRLGFGGLLLGEELDLEPVRRRWRFEQQLALGVQAGLDLVICSGSADLQAQVFETFVKLQEEREGLDPELEDGEARLLAAREGLLLGRHVPGIEVVGCARHKDLALLARVRGA